MGYTITSGAPTPDELLAIEEALKRHVKPHDDSIKSHSAWAAPQLRSPLPRKA